MNPVSLYLYSNMCNFIIYLTVQKTPLGSYNVLSHFAHQHVVIGTWGNFDSYTITVITSSFFTPLDIDIRLTCWLRWCALKYYFTIPVNISNMTENKGKFTVFRNANIIINVVNYK